MSILHGSRVAMSGRESNICGVVREEKREEPTCHTLANQRDLAATAPTYGARLKKRPMSGSWKP
jgi:hypothetical protein